MSKSGERMLFVDADLCGLTLLCLPESLYNSKKLGNENYVRNYLQIRIMEGVKTHTF